MKVSQMVRAALQVSDLDNSIKFYKEVLGLTEVYTQGTASGGNMHALVGMPESVSIKICVLKQPEYSAFGMVGLFQILNPSPPKIQRPSEGSNIGELCMVFYCSNLDVIMKNVEKHNHYIISKPINLEVGGVVKQREMSMRGPDGEKINLIEWDPDKASEFRNQKAVL
tara:strand:- start:954 stop:1457 length:504 start_codon:yes stop_codon:yes gene_type:complete